MPHRAKREFEDEQNQSLLTGEVGRLADEVRVLRDTIEELRENLWYGIINDKFACCIAANDASRLRPSADELSLGPNAVASLSGDLQDVVRQQFRNELAGLTDTLNDFSLDLQYVLRQARDRDQPHLCCENPHLAWRGPLDNAAVACQSCGFVLSDDGQLVDWHHPDEIAAERELKADKIRSALDSNSVSSSPPAISPSVPRSGLLFDIEPE